ncbi:hypothetical protein M2401_001140 [Pseudomonas sp. JUb42]|nr:hypothetical protein [Pseudomonas sp. JUb42]
MHTSATLHIHPTCLHNPNLIKQLQHTTRSSVIFRDGQPILVPKPSRCASPSKNGGQAA